MKEYSIGILGVAIGIMLDVSMPGAFTRPWFEKGIYLGDSVVHAPEKQPFYVFCKKGKVVYKETDEAIVVRWSQCQHLGYTKDYVFFETHRADKLRLK